MMTDHTELKNAIAEGLADIEAKYNERIDALATELAQKGDLLLVDKRKPNPLRSIAKDQNLLALKARNTKHATIPLNVGLTEIKAALVADANDSDGAGYSVHPQRLPGLANDPRRRLGLLDFLPTLPVTSGSFTFNRLSGYTNAADYQSEQGATKAEASILPT